MAGADATLWQVQDVRLSTALVNIPITGMGNSVFWLGLWVEFRINLCEVKYDI